MTTPQPSPILLARASMLASGVRTDSKMFALPIPAFEMLASLIFLQRVAPQAALTVMEQEGVAREKLPSVSALYQWQRDFSPFFAVFSLRAVREQANKVKEEMQRSPGEWAELVAQQIGQATFEMGLDPGCDPDVREKFTKLVIAFKAQKNEEARGGRDERKLKLLEDDRQAAKAEVNKAVAKGGLSPETAATIQQSLSLL